MDKIISLEPGTTYVFGKGYYDYSWWYGIVKSGGFFVTRFKKNAAISPISSQIIPASDKGVVLEDTIVEFTKSSRYNSNGNECFGTQLRRIVVHGEDKDTPLIQLILATNDFSRSAAAVAALYKRRWAIELFFNWLKQKLKIKKFIDRSKNAVKIQIYTALITYLLLKLCHQAKGVTCSLKLFMTQLRSTLFQRPNLEWGRLQGNLCL